MTICKGAGCTRQARYNVEGLTPHFCSTHKAADMVDVASKRCEHPECKKGPSYGFAGGKKRFCVSHKLDGMVAVQDLNRKCEHAGCQHRATCGSEGEKPRYCATHAPDGMVNTVSQRCEHPGCSLHPTYAYPGEKTRRRCQGHMEPGMVDIAHSTCNEPDCGTRPGFGFEGEPPKYCKLHRRHGMIDLVNPRCRSGCGVTANPDKKAYEGLCITCFYDEYPDQRDWSSSLYVYERRTYEELGLMQKKGIIRSFKTQARLENVTAYDASDSRSGKDTYAFLWVDCIFKFTDKNGVLRTCAIEVDGGQHTRVADAEGFHRLSTGGTADEEDADEQKLSHTAGNLGLIYERDVSKEQRLLQDGVSVVRISCANSPTDERWRELVRAAVRQCVQAAVFPLFVTHPVFEYKRLHDGLSEVLSSAAASASSPPVIPHWRLNMLPLQGIDQPRPRKRSGGSSSAIPSSSTLSGPSSRVSVSSSAAHGLSRSTNAEPLAAAAPPHVLATLPLNAACPASSPDEAAATSSKKRRRIIPVEDSDDEE